MAFPLSPTNGQTTILNGITYVYNSTYGAWTRIATATPTLVASTTASTTTASGALVVAGGVGVAGTVTAGNIVTVNGIYNSSGVSLSQNSTSSATAPASPNIGDIWYNTATDDLYRWTSDGVATYWLDINGPTALTTTPTGNISVGNVLITSGVFWSSNGNAYSSGGGITYTAANSAPNSATVGSQWYYIATDTLYEYISDGTSTYWVDVESPINFVTNTLSIGTSIIPSANTALTLGSNVSYFANVFAGNLTASSTLNLIGNLLTTSNITAAYFLGNLVGTALTANSIVANTSTVTGNLTVNGNVLISNILLTSTGTVNANSAIFSSASGTAPLTINIAGTQTAVFDNLGNFGLGVTPSAWYSVNKAIQVNAGGALSGSTSTISQVNLSANWYNNASGVDTFIGTGYATLYQQNVGSHRWFTSNASGTAGNAITFTQAMTLDVSGNLMVNQTSPTGKFSVTGTGSNNTGILAINGTDTSSSFVWASQAYDSGMTTGQNFIHMIGKAGSTLNAAYVGYKYSGTAGSANNLLTFGHFASDNLMNLDGNGNLGLGVTPSAWGSSYKAVQMPYATMMNSSSGGYYGANFYYNSSNNPIYVNNGYALAYSAYSAAGAHLWLTAPSGTAGNAITFTQAMTLDSSGNLLIGYTSSNGSYKLQVNSQIFATSSTIATSDARYKENVEELSGALDIVKALRPVSFDWKAHPIHNFDTTTKTVGFLAQDVQQTLAGKPYLNSIIKTNECVIEPEVKDKNGNVTKEAVTEEFLGIAEGNMISILTAAIQELSAQVTTLQSQVTALQSKG